MARGDHIKVTRRNGLYSHHGIDMGDGTVIHFSGEPFQREKATICRVSMVEFLAGGRLVVVNYRGGVLTPEEVAANAETALARQKYCLWRNNCEHFATGCKTGRRRSRQVRRVMHLAAGSAGAAIAVLLPILLARRTATS
jgi:hypothetical protein